MVSVAWLLPSRFDPETGMASEEEKICRMEAARWWVEFMEQEACREQIVFQTPWNWKCSYFDHRQGRLFRGYDYGECRGKKAATISIRYFLGCRMFLEQQVYFGGVNFDPQLSNLFLFPLAGLVAIALSETCTAPLSRITLLSQLGKLGGGGEEEAYRSISEQAAQIVEQEGGGAYGYAALWRGNLISVAHRLSFYTINIFAYLGFRALLMSSSVAMKPASWALVSGGLAAFTATSLTHPLDTLKTRIIALQTSKSKRQEGSRYAGLTASLLKIVPSMAITFTVYEGLSFVLSKLRPNGSFFMTALVAGSIAGLAASTATYPIDVVQKRMQLEDRKPGSRGRGVRQVFGQIIEEEGVEGLYKGIRPHCFKTVLAHATALTTYEIIKVPSYIAFRSISPY